MWPIIGRKPPHVSRRSRRLLSSFLDLRRHPGSGVALVDPAHPVSRGGMTYSELSRRAGRIAAALAPNAADGANVALLCPNSALWACAAEGAWRAGACLTPLHAAHPEEALRYYVEDSGAKVILASESLREKTETLSKLCGDVDVLYLERALQNSEGSVNISDTPVEDERDTMIVYTSGTTGPPKGAVLSAGNLRWQARAMIEAWGWTRDDRLLHVLPLHHVHGITNCLLTPLFAGASVDVMPGFNPKAVWRKLLRPSRQNPFKNLEDFPEAEAGPDGMISVFMAVPTVYAKLLSSFDSAFPTKEERSKVKETLRRDLRLTVSGSAALPETVLERWEEVSGHTLLERYGMTEIGMALTNPLRPEGARRPGRVGRPFPGGARARIVSREPREVLAEADSDTFEVFAGKNEKSISGDLQISGPGVFSRYQGRPEEATEKEFEREGDRRWFLTGDTAEMDQEDGTFKILGRTSVDIIKSGGYKISALDIERVLLTHPAAVLGLDDDTWGEVVAAVVVSSSPEDLTLQALQDFCGASLPPYSVPRRLKLMEELPRNQMGKVNKRELVKIAFPQE